MPKDLWGFSIVSKTSSGNRHSESFKSLNKQLAKTGRAETDLIVLPEMFSTGFSMNAKKLAEQMEGSFDAVDVRNGAGVEGCCMRIRDDSRQREVL